MRGRVALGVVGGVALVASTIQVVRLQCEWGTFAYLVEVESPTSQEDWRADAAVLVEGHEKVVTTHHEVVDVALSPDATRVVVARATGPTDDEYVGVDPVGLYLYDVDGSNERRLTTRGTEPAWSPDGETIAFLDGTTVRTVTVDEGEQREVYRVRRGSDGYLVDAAWSPDSRRIAVAVGRLRGPTATDLWHVRADGTGRRYVRVVDGDASDLAWSPDGELLAWSGEHRGVRSVVVLPVDGGAVRQVEPNSQSPVWSDDGSQLAYVIGHEGHYRSRIVVGDANGVNEVAAPVHGEAPGATSLEDWASC